MLATTILANYTVYYIILYCITYSTTHISCIWYDTYAYIPQKVFIQLWINFTQLVQDIRGMCVFGNKYTQYKYIPHVLCIYKVVAVLTLV